MSKILKYKPITPGYRHKVHIYNSYLYKGHSNNFLTKGKKRKSGRNNQGRITVRHIGGGAKYKYRKIDFKRNKDNIIGYLKYVEYDPNRSAYIGLIIYIDGEKRYILYPKNLCIKDSIISGLSVPIKIGNHLPLLSIPLGTYIHNIELYPGRGGQLIRSAGSYAVLVSKEDKYALIKLRSGELRKILLICKATIGCVGYSKYLLRELGKAGTSRHLGIRPTVRGTAMNPVDHPHGGGEGRNFGKHPVTPWGISTKGYKTRNNKRTNKYIIKSRHM